MWYDACPFGVSDAAARREQSTGGSRVEEQPVLAAPGRDRPGGRPPLALRRLGTAGCLTPPSPSRRGRQLAVVGLGGAPPGGRLPRAGDGFPRPRQARVAPSPP